MLARGIVQVLKERLRNFPAVALIGPRQSGKTTLARSLKGAYFDLEQDADRVRLDLQWESLSHGQEMVLLDEAQAWPEIFTRLRAAIDSRRNQMGRFLLLGSVSPALMKQVSESLAGRLTLVELTPFLLTELPPGSQNKLWLFGGFPDGGILNAKQYPQWQQDYISLLTQRDLPNWGLPAKPQVTQRLLKMLAGVHGQLWNASQIAQSLGLTYPTVNSYLDYLEGAFLIRRLAPYYANLSKRLVKSPKVYWRDSGLLHSILRVDGFDDLLAQSWVGASWEGYVIEQVLGAFQQAGKSVEPYFLRTSDQYELDLLLDLGRTQWAFEIKLTGQPKSADLSRLNKTADLINAHLRILISQTSDSIEEKNQISCSLPWFIDFIHKHFGKKN
ncbi:MAG: ATP-binding protein [Planctomycetes bacterium]|nr:ATP-binding protein [Planctomycetota bacterium]